MCRNIRIKFLSWAYMYTTLKLIGKRVIQTNPSKFDERLFSGIYLCRYLRQRERATERCLGKRGCETHRETERCLGKGAVRHTERAT